MSDRSQFEQISKDTEIQVRPSPPNGSPSAASGLGIAIVDTFHVDSFETDSPPLLLRCTTEADSPGAAPASCDGPSGAAEPSLVIRSASSGAPIASAEAGGPVGWCIFPDCGAPCSSWEEYLEHQKTSHPNANKTRSQAERRQHSKARAGLDWDLPCPRCTARLPTGPLLQTHLEDFHRVEGTPVVEDCAAVGRLLSFASWEEFHEHYRLVHRVPNTKTWQTCRSCLAPCADAAAAQRHAQEHLRKRRYDCSFCSASFLNKISGDTHMLEFHQMHGLRPARSTRSERRAW